MMLVNGERRTSLELSDRGLAYGDGLFETLLVEGGRPTLPGRHLARLSRGCARLGIPDCRAALEADLDLLAVSLPCRGVLKIMVTRGSGGRGYRPGDGAANRILSLHPAPDYGSPDPARGIRAFLCRQRLARQPALAGIKHLNRLEQVLASAEWPAEGAFLEGLMLDGEGLLVEGTRSNLFWSLEGRLCTPALDYCGIEGIAREVLLERFGGEVELGYWPLQALEAAGEAFVCNSVNGIWPLTSLALGDGREWRFEPGRWVERARQALQEALKSDA